MHTQIHDPLLFWRNGHWMAGPSLSFVESWKLLDRRRRLGPSTFTLPSAPRPSNGRLVSREEYAIWVLVYIQLLGWSEAIGDFADVAIGFTIEPIATICSICLCCGYRLMLVQLIRVRQFSANLSFASCVVAYFGGRRIDSGSTARGEHDDP